VPGASSARRAGSRHGRIVLVRDGSPSADPAGAFTVKEYRSERVWGDDGNFLHTRIELRTRSRNTVRQPIVLTPEDEGEVRVMAELVEVGGYGRGRKVAPRGTRPHPETFVTGYDHIR